METRSTNQTWLDTGNQHGCKTGSYSVPCSTWWIAKKIEWLNVCFGVTSPSRKIVDMPTSKIDVAAYNRKLIHVFLHGIGLYDAGRCWSPFWKYIGSNRHNRPLQKAATVAVEFKITAGSGNFFHSESSYSCYLYRPILYCSVSASVVWIVSH